MSLAGSFMVFMTPDPITLFIFAILDCLFLYFVFVVIRGIFRFLNRLFSRNETETNFAHVGKVFWPPTAPAPTPLPAQVQEEKYPYEKQEYLLTPTELKFYRVLKPICDERNLAIFSKVRLEDLVTVPQYVFNNWKWRGYIRSRHIDFVLCDASNLKIRCAVELDDWHHKFWRNHEIDERKNKILRDAGLPLIRVRANQSYDLITLSQIIENNIGQSHAMA
jgi:hypothetical protein